jgi:hypothetical protein
MSESLSIRVLALRKSGQSDQQIGEALGIPADIARQLPYDEAFYGPGGIDSSKWAGHCMMGAQYKDNGPSRDGAANQVRKISSGRKHRGMASDGLK